MFYYYDTCAIAKAFHIERGSDVILKLLEADTSNAFISELTLTEFYSTTYKKLRAREISKEAVALQVCQKFETAMHYFNIVNADGLIYTEAKNLISKWGSKYDIRTLDSLHLATFVQLRHLDEITFVSADKKLCNIAKQLGFDVINPEQMQKEEPDR